MLSTSAARGLGPSAGGVPGGARCVASFYDHVYIGTEDGRVCLVSGGEHLTYQAPAGKPIVQLLALGEIGLVLALCNGAVEGIDAQRLRHRPAVKLNIKTEILGLVLNETPVPDFSVCAFTSHKAHLFRWVGEKYEPWKVINVPSPPLDAAWALHKLCVAMEDQVTLLDVPTGRSLKVHEFPAGERRRKRRMSFSFASSTYAAAGSSAAVSASPPASLSPSQAAASSAGAAHASPDSMSPDAARNRRRSVASTSSHMVRGSNICALSRGRFLMIVDGLGIVINASGQPSGSTIVWSSPPLQTVCTLDFAVSVHDDGRRVEVHSTEPRGIVAETTSVDFPVVALVAPAPWNALATHAAAAASGASADAPDSDEPVLENLTAGGGVFMLTPSAVLNLGTVSLKQRMEDLFDADDIAAAFRVYSERVLAPFEEAHRVSDGAQTRAVHRRLARQLSAGAEALAIDPDVFASRQELVAHFHLEAGIAMLRKGLFSKALQQFSFAKLDPREIITHYPQLCPPYAQHYAPKRLRVSIPAGVDADGAASLLGIVRDRSASTEADLRAALKTYLAGLREKAAHGPDVARFLDFALFRLYLDPPHEDADEEALRSLCASKDNALDVLGCAQVLMDKERYHAAALLYGSSAEHHRQALQVWADLGAGQLAEAGVDGAKETISFLRAHHDQADLVWAFSPWVLERDPDHAITIFTEAEAQTESEAADLDPEMVLAHLAKFDKSPRSRLQLRFLDHMTRGKQARARSFDLRAASQYIQTLETCPAPLRADVRADFAAFIDRPETLSTRVEEPGAGHESTFEADLAARQIDLASLADPLLREKASLYAKCGWHGQALAILVKDLRDPQAAEAYCVRHYHHRRQAGSDLRDSTASTNSPNFEDGKSPSSEFSRGDHSGHSAGTEGRIQAGDNPFLELVCLYFEPALAEKYRDNSLEILEKYGRFIDPSLVMSKLPADMRLNDLQAYLSFVFRANVQRLSHLQVVKNLCVAQNIKTLYQTSRVQKRNFAITQDTLCRVCSKPILTQAFAVDPNMRTVVHHACLHVDGDISERSPPAAIIPIRETKTSG